MNESTSEIVCEREWVHMLDVLGRESMTVQVRTSNSWMRGEDGTKKHQESGIRQPNLNSSALLRHTRPPAVWQEQNTLSSTLSDLEYMQLAKHSGLSYKSGSLSGCLSQTWFCEDFLLSSYCFHMRRIQLRRTRNCVCACVHVCEKESTHSLNVCFSFFGLWLQLPQNKYVLKAWVFIDITAYQIQSPQAIFEPGTVKNRPGSPSPRRRTNSVKRHDAFLNHDIITHVLVPKTLPQKQKMRWEIFL